MPAVLDDTAVTEALRELPEWSGDGQGIHRTADLPDFLTAIAVVVDVARTAEEMNHHPDIDIRYSTLTFACSTHSEGGVTDLDVRLAGQIDEIVARRAQQ